VPGLILGSGGAGHDNASPPAGLSSGLPREDDVAQLARSAYLLDQLRIVAKFSVLLLIDPS